MGTGAGVMADRVGGAVVGVAEAAVAFAVVVSTWW